jgi:hypothetical protein
LLLMLKLESTEGTPDRPVAAFERVRTLVESDAIVKFGQGFKTRAMLALAEARLRANDPAGGEQWVRRALENQRRGDGPTPASLSGAVAKSLQGILLLHRDRSADALLSLRAGHDEASTLFGPDNLTTRLLSLNTALALEMLGRSSEALSIVERAAPALRKALGSDAPSYLRVIDFRDRLERAAASGPPSSRDAGPSAFDTGDSKHPRVDFFN